MGSSPQSTRGNNMGSSPQSTRGNNMGSSPQSTRGNNMGSSPQSTPGNNMGSSPQSTRGNNMGSSPQITWVLLHKVHEEDAKSKANLRAAPKLDSKALHPGRQQKQDVTRVLSIFHPTTAAGIKKFFPENQAAALSFGGPFQIRNVSFPTT